MKRRLAEKRTKEMISRSAFFQELVRGNAPLKKIKVGRESGCSVS